MIISRVRDMTRSLGAPKGWDPNDSGPCYGLPVRIEKHGENNCFVSAWEPTPDELAALNRGAKVMLRVVGDGHPPVMVYVDQEPDADVPGPVIEREAIASLIERSEFVHPAGEQPPHEIWLAGFNACKGAIAALIRGMP